jgi:hypothetical protein
MGAATTFSLRIPAQFRGAGCANVTLLQLVEAICDITSDDEEVVATALHMLRSGCVRLCGNFRGSDPEELA